MKKMFVFGIVVGAILALGAMAFSVYSATSASAANGSQPGFASGFGQGISNGLNFVGEGPGPGLGKPGDNALTPYVEEATAEILGISVDELKTAQEEGQRLPDLIEAAGLTVDEFRTALEDALPSIVDQALADEAITQEQADFILAHGIGFIDRHHGPGGPGGPDGFGRFGIEGDGVLQPYVETAIANILGLSTEEFQAAKEEGTRMPELLENAGLTLDEFQTAMEEALPSIVDQALTDGVITQAQADYLLENGLRGAKGYLNSALHEYVDAAIADILGVSVEELQTARDEGTVADLLAAAGLTREDFQAALDKATPGIVEQALEDGVITQEQADFLIENGLRGFGPGGKGPGGDCPGGRGPQGGGPGGQGGFGGPGGLGPGNQNAPATDTSSNNG